MKLSRHNKDDFFNNYFVSREGNLFAAQESPHPLAITQSTHSSRITKRNKIGGILSLASFVTGYIIGVTLDNAFANDQNDVAAEAASQFANRPSITITAKGDTLKIKPGHFVYTDSTTSTDADGNIITTYNDSDFVAQPDTIVKPNLSKRTNKVVLEDKTDFILSNDQTHNVKPTGALLQPSMYTVIITPYGVNDVNYLFRTVTDKLGKNIQLKVMPADRLLTYLSLNERNHLGNRKNVIATYRTLQEEAGKYPAADSATIAMLNEAGKDFKFDPKKDSSLVDLINDSTNTVVGFKFFKLPGKAHFACYETTFARGDTIWMPTDSEFVTIKTPAGEDSDFYRYTDSTIVKISPDTTRVIPIYNQVGGQSVSAVVHVIASPNDAYHIEDKLIAFMGESNHVVVPDTFWLEKESKSDSSGYKALPDTSGYKQGSWLRRHWKALTLGIGGMITTYLLSRGKNKGHGGSSEKPGIY